MSLCNISSNAELSWDIRVMNFTVSKGNAREKRKKNLFYGGEGQALEHVAQRGSGVPVCGNIEPPLDMGLGTCPGCPSWSRGAGQGGLGGPSPPQRLCRWCHPSDACFSVAAKNVKPRQD